MTFTRDVRRCALQALYQFDSVAIHDAADVLRSLEEAPGGERAQHAGYELAHQAWAQKAEADAMVAALTPDWPTYRQPIVDRSILRLAYFEMAHGDTPPKVAINEAVELAKEFSTERSPMFINGVLDKIYRQLREQGAAVDEIDSMDAIDAGVAADETIGDKSAADSASTETGTTW